MIKNKPPFHSGLFVPPGKGYIHKAAPFLEETGVRVLTDVAQLVGCNPTEQNVTGSIPSQGTSLGCGFSPQRWCWQEAPDPCFSYTCFCSSPPSLPLSLKINK